MSSVREIEVVLISQSFHDLHDYSITHRSEFWAFCWSYFNLIHEGSYTRVVNESARIDSIPTWFDGVRLNFAENILFSDSSGATVGKEDDKIAVTEIGEGGAHNPVHLKWRELRQRTAILMESLKAHGVTRGDRVAVCSANRIHTLLVFLATAGIGAIFSSSSTDMGVDGLLERLLQIRPRWLFMDDQTIYDGKCIDLRDKMGDIIEGMRSTREFQGIVSQPRFDSQPSDISQTLRTMLLSEFLADMRADTAPVFERVAFGDPFLIVYSSGTTGRPKCIIHSVGGVLMNARKEGSLHNELGPDSIGLQYTTTGWIMYLSAIQALLFGSRVVLYDGSPFFPQKSSLVAIAEQEKYDFHPRNLSLPNFDLGSRIWASHPAICMSCRGHISIRETRSI